MSEIAILQVEDLIEEFYPVVKKAAAFKLNLGLDLFEWSSGNLYRQLACSQE